MADAYHMTHEMRAVVKSFVPVRMEVPVRKDS